jgi:hypothetical protein
MLLNGRLAPALRLGRLCASVGEGDGDASPRVAQYCIDVSAAQRARFALDHEVIVRRPETAVWGIVIAVHTHILAAAIAANRCLLIQQ